MSDLPKALRDAMEQLLEADDDLARATTPRSNVERIDALRAARPIIAEWRRGNTELADAVCRIEALVARSRSP